MTRKNKGKSKGRTSNEASKESTPLHSASEDDTPPPKKQKSQKRVSKTSADVAEEFGAKDVELEYTEADYTNLTTFSLFSRMVRPQVSAANPRLSSSKMTQIMESKWKEFREANPLKSKTPRREPVLPTLPTLEKRITPKGKEQDHSNSRSSSRKKTPIKFDDSDEVTNEDTPENSLQPLKIATNISPMSCESEESAKKKKKKKKKSSHKSDKKSKPIPTIVYTDDSQDDFENEAHLSSRKKIKIVDSDEEEDEDDMSLVKRSRKSKETYESQASKKNNSSRSKSKPVIQVFDEEDDEIKSIHDSDDDEIVADSDSSESEVELQKRKPSKNRHSTGSLKIKLPSFGVRKSGRERKTVRRDGVSDKELKSVIDDEGSGSGGSNPRRKSRSKRKQEYSDDLSDFANDSQSCKKKSKTIYSDSDDSLASGPSRRKSRSQKDKEKSNRSLDSDEYLSSESSDSLESDSDIDSDRPKRVKKSSKRNIKPTRISIPGERKSDRSRTKVNYDLNDKAFEKMLFNQEKEAEEDKKRKHERQIRLKKKKNRAKKLQDRMKEMIQEGGKKGYWQDRNKEKEGEAEAIDIEKIQEKEKEIEKEKEDGNESDHYWYCEVCKDGGDLLLCDTCPKSFHQKCINVTDVPDGDWSCPVCTGEGLPELGDSEEENHDHVCKICRDGGDVLLCDFCPYVFHLHCLNPPRKEAPEGEWKCAYCLTKERPMKAKITKILTWRWSHQLEGTDELDHTASPLKKAERNKVQQMKDLDNDDSKDSSDTFEKRKPERELFCKFEHHSYWDCEWVAEIVVEVFQNITHSFFKKRWDLDEPPALEDGSSFGRPRHKSDADSDPHKLEERYYRWGIKPEWLQFCRIINHDGKGKDLRYLVKWRDLDYNDCTWEYTNEIDPGTKEDFDKSIDKYWARRKERTKDKKPAKEKAKKLLMKKLEKQPSYLGETGGNLHPYQLEGLNWMRFSYAQGTNTILADEMGLGKTIQAIAILYALWKEGYAPGPFLVTAPLSTVPNWEREFEFWAPEMYVVTYAGQKENRVVIREHEFSYKEGAFSSLNAPCRLRTGFPPKFDVLLTSYEYPSVDRATLASIHWSVLVIDEAHRLKNNTSLFFRTLSGYNLDYKLLLTGTPLQNNLEELFCLLNFLEPGKFSDMEEFLGTFSEISKEEQVTRLHEMLAPHMLRRLKIDVLKDLPDKTELIVRVELSAMQKKFYKHILTKNFTALNVRGHANQTSMQNVMMDLRKCCNHPYLFPTADVEAPINRRGLYEGSALTKASGKLELLGKMLAKLRATGHRVLIFSQMTRVLDLLEDFMDFHEFKYERIDGGITGSKRQTCIDRFNDPNSAQFIFLLSTKAGGLGINLATADTVVIFDMDWNPHNDIQAFSRAHRIGQKNKVMIYRFVSCNTVEEKMAQVCKQKMMLTELVITRGMGKVGEKVDSLTKQEVNEILKHGAEELFTDDGGKAVVYDDAAVDKLLERDQVGETKDVPEESAMNDYLRSFKVASYQVKEGQEAEQEEDEEKPSTSAAAMAEVEKPDDEEENYWGRVLGDSYAEHLQKLQNEADALAKTLGKGKRQRKRINYAEQQQIALEIAAAKKKYEDAQDDEDYKAYSDYSDSADSVNSDAEYTAEEKSKKNSKTKQSKIPTQALPPLLARINGQIEVLGFSARQRRAFLDAIMRFGMPHDDPYRSQIMVRDIRNKPERVLKAYVSLFMRHLCEPMAEDATTFADGIPREGLSRHHVLTRIGMIALIRRKVAEFESHNGTDSMKEFRKAPTVIGAVKGAILLDILDNSNDKPETDKANATTDIVDVDKDKSEKKGEEKGETEIDQTNSTSQTDVIKTKIDEKCEEDISKTETDKPSASNENTAVEKEMHEDTAKGEETVKDMDKSESSLTKEDVSKTECIDDDKNKMDTHEDVKVIDNEKGNLEAEPKSKLGDQTDEDVLKDKPQKEEAMEVDLVEENTKENPATEKDEMKIAEKDTDEVKTTETEATGTEMDVSVEKVSISGDKIEILDDDDDVEKKDVDHVDNDEEKEDGENKGSIEAKKDENIEGNDKDKNIKIDENSDEKVKETVETVDGKNTDTEKTKDDEVLILDSPEKSPKEKIETKKISEPISIIKTVKEPSPVKKSYTEITAELREKFWVADGGFTELHALWQVEEMNIKPGKEPASWHRRHDYWLLLGIATHGYRHWQDIVNDNRFEIINKAFHTEEHKMRKAAFLNRRFQLLEQALVIEEQLRKAVRHDQETSKTEGAAVVIDSLTEADNLAVNLRKVNQGGQDGKPPDKKTHKLLNKVAHLVQDIKQATYTKMPATLAKAPSMMTSQRPTAAAVPRHAAPVQRPAPPPQVTSIPARNPTVAQLMAAKKQDVICID